MKKVLIFILFAFALAAKAQQLPVEHILFSPDREDYKQSDMIEISGKVVSNDSVPYSRYLDMELWNAEDSLIVHQKLRCEDDGSFTTKVQIPFDVESGVYYLRAYTRLMLNYPLTTLPIEQVFVGRIKNETEPDMSELRCAFYPEGGHARRDIAQCMSVRVLSKDGKAVRVPYFICDEKGDTICADTTTHSGWQRFILKQEGVKRYYFCAKNSLGEVQRFPLPDAESAPIITSQVSRQQLVYNVFATDEERSELALYVYHPNIGLQFLPVTPKTGVMRLDDLPEGMLSLLLVNGEKEVVSQTFQYIQK